MLDILNRLMDWILANNVSASEAIMNVLLTVLTLAVVVSMWKLHHANSRYENFNVITLFLNKDGFLDGAKCMELGAWILMSWGFVAQVTAGKLSDAYTAAYVGAFVVRGGYSAFLRSKGDPISPEGTTTITKTSTDTTEVSKTPQVEQPKIVTS